MELHENRSSVDRTKDLAVGEASTASINSTLTIFAEALWGEGFVTKIVTVYGS